MGKLKDLEGPQRRLRRNGHRGRGKPEESVVLSAKWGTCSKRRRISIVSKAVVR